MNQSPDVLSPPGAHLRQLKFFRKAAPLHPRLELFPEGRALSYLATTVHAVVSERCQIRITQIEEHKTDTLMDGCVGWRWQRSALGWRGYVSTCKYAARLNRLPHNQTLRDGTIRARITWPLKILIIHQSLEWLLFISCWCSVGWLRFYTALTSAVDGREYSLWACYIYKNCKQGTASAAVQIQLLKVTSSISVFVPFWNMCIKKRAFVLP